MTARLRRLRARARALKAQWRRAYMRVWRQDDVECDACRRCPRCRQYDRATRIYLRYERAEKDVREERAHG